MKVLATTQDRYRRRYLIATLVCLALLIVLTVAVVSGITESLDVSARESFRPDLMWGDDQKRANHVLTWMSSRNMLVLLAVGSAAVSLWRLTLWPVVQAVSALALTGGLVFVLKFLVHRADPTGAHASLGGSYPSGHSAVLLACVGTIVMLASCPTRWWQWTGCLALESVLAIAMMYVALHWLTDIIGGALTAGVGLGFQALAAGPDGGPSHRGRRTRFRLPARVAP